MTDTRPHHYDWTIIADRSIWLFEAVTQAAQEWAEDHIDQSAYRPRDNLYPVEPRYAFGLATCLSSHHGFHIAINGQAVVAQHA